MMTCEYLLLDRHEINLSTFQLNGNFLSIIDLMLSYSFNFIDLFV